MIDFPPREWLSESDPVEGVPTNRGGHGTPEKILVEELKAAGFRIKRVVEDWPEEELLCGGEAGGIACVSMRPKIVLIEVNAMKIL